MLFCKNIFSIFLLIIPLLFGCQKQFNKPPYNDYEEKIRKLPLETQKIIIPKEWQKMDSLSFLRLHNVSNIIIDADSIPSWITKFENAKTIYSQYGQISQIPTAINKLKSLEKITIFTHRVKYVPESICDLENLKFLSFWSNEITSLPTCIFTLKKIKILNLIGNNLTVIPSEIIKMKRLEKLLLDGNQIRELPENIYNLPKLKEISLSGNPLKNPEKVKKKFSEKGIKVNLE